MAVNETILIDFTDILNNNPSDAYVAVYVNSSNNVGNGRNLSKRYIKKSLLASLLLQTNGVNNPLQSVLNLIAGSNITLTPNGVGGVTIDSSGGGGGTYTVDNGLTESPANNFQLGGTLIQNTTIDADTYLLDITGTDSVVFQVANTNAVSGTGAFFSSLIGNAIGALSNGSQAIYAQSVADIEAIKAITKFNGTGDTKVLKLDRIASSAGGVGVGASASIDMGISQSATLPPSRTSIKTRWEAGSSNYSLEAWVTDTNVLYMAFKISPVGQLRLPKYGIGTFVTAPTYLLGVDASGNVVETTAGGSGTVTSVAATVPTPTNPAFSVNVPNPTTTPSVDITALGLITDYIAGDGSLVAFPDLTVFVPYTGATGNVNLGVNSFIADDGTFNTEMSPSYFGVQNNASTIFALLEYNQLTLTDNTLPSVLSISATGITFPDLTVQTTAAVTDVTATSPITSSGGATPDISTSMSTNKLIGRGTAGTGVMEEITLGTGLSLSGTTLNATSSGGGLLHGTTSGTDTYTVTITGATAYTDGDAYLIRFAIGNTTSATLNINGQGAIPLYRNNDGPLLGGDVIAGGEMICVYNSTTNVFQCIGISPNSLVAYVTNDDSVTITKGQPVYAFSGTGDRMTVKLAYNTGDSTSAQTVGLVLSTSIAANQKGLIMMQGLLDGLNNVKPVNGWADGSPVYLGTTAGSITPTKQYAPNHLVYLGFVTTASPGSAGRVYVRVQNGYELDELHNVQAQTPANNDTLYYDNTVTPKQWKTASIATILGYTPVATSRSISTTSPLSGGGDLSADRTLSIADAAADGATKGAAAFTANDFNASAGVISIDYTNGQAASSVNKGFLTAADWNTFNSYGSSTYKNVIDSAAVTGTTLNTKVASQLVTANRFTVGDILQIKARTSKVGVLGLMTLRVYINTADSLTVPPATLISTSTTNTNAQINFGIDKNAVIKSATITQTMNALSNAIFLDPQTSTLALTNSNIDWTVNQYIIFAIQNVSATDSTLLSYYQILKQ